MAAGPLFSALRLVAGRRILRPAFVRPGRPGDFPAASLPGSERLICPL
jgi:hypothetical protein